MKWSELNTLQFANVDRNTICVLPLGAVEQHGPHLPVATDQILADSIAERLDDGCQGELLLMPSMHVTYSEHHMAFAGTLTLSQNTLERAVLQMLRSAFRHGFDRFFILNAHGGNISIGGVIAQDSTSQLPDAQVVFATWFRAAATRLRPLVKGSYPAVGHACEFETSMMLALRPDLVDREAIVDDGVATNSTWMQADLLVEGPAVRAVPFEHISRSGVWGKPSLATPEKGEAILDIVVATLTELLAEYWPDSPGIASSSHPQDRSVAK